MISTHASPGLVPLIDAFGWWPADVDTPHG
jgi:hypothetical protein